MTASASHHTLTPFCITTAIDYVNGAPHLGHAYEKIATDAMARYQRLWGRSVFFLSGTDEHGVKIQKNAQSKGIDTQTFVDTMAQGFRDAWDLCQVFPDRFIRTTEAEHKEVVTLLWHRLMAQGDIYKASYEGLYCSGCEAFLNERDLSEEGYCQIHQTPPEKVIEQNYFFRLSHYKESLKKHFTDHPDYILPQFRQAEVFKMLEDLNDISVSRSRQSVSWGIPVPNDPEQVIYVWIDALSNYLSGVGYLSNPDQFALYWMGPQGEPQVTHVIGKDILRFHAIYWGAMLLAAQIPLPKHIFAHGFITLNDEKISKSLGNVVAPMDLMTHYDLPHSDPIRYYLLASNSFAQDGNFQSDDFKLKVNADLSNNLGNLLNRTLSMLAKYFEGNVPAVPESVPLSTFAALSQTEKSLEAIQLHVEQFAFNKAIEIIFETVNAANAAINTEEPWTLHKTGQQDRLATLMRALLECLRQTAILLSPITPSLSRSIWQQLGQPLEETHPANGGLSSSLLFRWEDCLRKPLPEGQQTLPSGPILPRLDSELAASGSKKAG
jgi:methionyl-tRNA synthetase